MSVWIFVLTFAYYFYPKIQLLALLPIAIHFVALLQSIHAVYIKKQSTETLSKDCIWFNFLMLVVYSSFALVIVYR